MPIPQGHIHTGSHCEFPRNLGAEKSLTMWTACPVGKPAIPCQLGPLPLRTLESWVHSVSCLFISQWNPVEPLLSLVPFVSRCLLRRVFPGPFLQTQGLKETQAGIVTHGYTRGQWS